MKQAKASIDSRLPAKRGRGRPRVENPLSAAERARRYRERKRAADQPADKRVATAKTAAGRDAETSRLKAQLQAQLEAAGRWRREAKQLGQEIADLRSLVDMFIEARIKRKAIPADVFRNICASYLKK